MGFSTSEGTQVPMSDMVGPQAAGNGTTGKPSFAHVLGKGMGRVEKKTILGGAENKESDAEVAPPKAPPTGSVEGPAAKHESSAKPSTETAGGHSGVGEGRDQVAASGTESSCLSSEGAQLTSSASSTEAGNAPATGPLSAAAEEELTEKARQLALLNAGAQTFAPVEGPSNSPPAGRKQNHHNQYPGGAASAPLASYGLGVAPGGAYVQGGGAAAGMTRQQLNAMYYAQQQHMVGFGAPMPYMYGQHGYQGDMMGAGAGEIPQEGMGEDGPRMAGRHGAGMGMGMMGQGMMVPQYYGMHPYGYGPAAMYPHGDKHPHPLPLHGPHQMHPDYYAHMEYGMNMGGMGGQYGQWGYYGMGGHYGGGGGGRGGKRWDKCRQGAGPVGGKVQSGGSSRGGGNNGGGACEGAPGWSRGEGEQSTAGGSDRGRAKGVYGGPAAEDETCQVFSLSIDKIEGGDDERTTLMIRNIPNKYTQRNLLELIDANHRGSYDFFYLPIDFKNKCNLGYAFINFKKPISIAAFFNDFANKRWEKFNSEKVCVVSYARIQGQQGLVNHFKSSRLMLKHEKYRPILFNDDSGRGEMMQGPIRPAGAVAGPNSGAPRGGSGQREGGCASGPGASESSAELQASQGEESEGCDEVGELQALSAVMLAE